MSLANSASRRAANPLKVVALVGLIGACVLFAGFVWLSSLGNRSAGKVSAALVGETRKPVLSARRTPDVLAFITRTSRVKNSLAATSGLLPADSCLRVDWLGASMTSIRADTAYVPGSAAKLLTAAVALDVLGPETTFATTVRATRNPDGTVADLFVVGGGDPLIVRAEYVASEKYKTFNQTSLELMADTIVKAGVTSISGRLVGVDTFFDAERFVPDWPSEFHGTEAGPLGALMVNDGAVVGQPLKPDDPALAAVTELANLLGARGVTIGAGVAHDVLPQGTDEVTVVQSAPLSAVLTEMLVNSDNNTAEIMLKQIGAKSSGIGSTLEGLKAVDKKLQEWGIPAGVVMKDGSGLSSNDRISCSALQSVLEKFKGSLPTMLAVAGETGTLRDMFDSSPVKGVLRGKTGTLNGVKALAGYIPLDGEDPVRFSMILNRPGIDNRSAYRPIWNSLGDALSRASSSPRATDLAP